MSRNLASETRSWERRESLAASSDCQRSITLSNLWLMRTVSSCWLLRMDALSWSRSCRMVLMPSLSNACRPELKVSWRASRFCTELRLWPQSSERSWACFSRIQLSTTSAFQKNCSMAQFSCRRSRRRCEFSASLESRNGIFKRLFFTLFGL